MRSIAPQGNPCGRRPSLARRGYRLGLGVVVSIKRLTLNPPWLAPCLSPAAIWQLKRGLDAVLRDPKHPLKVTTDGLSGKRKGCLSLVAAVLKCRTN